MVPELISARLIWKLKLVVVGKTTGALFALMAACKDFAFCTFNFGGIYDCSSTDD